MPTAIAMDMTDFFEWFVRVIVAMVFIMTVQVAILLLTAVINDVRHQASRRRRRRRTMPPPPPPSFSVEEVLQSIPDVAYQEPPLLLPGGGDMSDDDDVRESCVICVTPYEAGETCCVLPACKHLFHKACVARWLRVRCTCPLCRTAVVAATPTATRGQQQPC